MLRRTSTARVGAAAAAGLLALVAAGPAHAFNYVPAANGDRWGVNDVAAPVLDTGSIRSTDSGALAGYGGLRVRVEGDELFNGELMRGFGLRFDGFDTFTTTKAVDMGGVAVSRDLKITRSDQYARWLETFTNTTKMSIKVEAMFGGRLGTGGGNSQTSVAKTSSGDALITPEDTWVTVASPTSAAGNPSQNGPSATVLGSPAPFSNRLTRVGNFLHDSFTADLAAPGTHEANFYGYEHEFTLLPGQTKTLLHYVVIGVPEARAFNGVAGPGAGVSVTAVSAKADTLASTPDLAGLSTAETCSLENYDPVALGASCADVTPIEPEPVVQATPKKTSSPYDVVNKTVAELQADMVSGKTTSQEITRAYLDRIAAYDTGPWKFNAYTTVATDAMEQAKAADEARAAGRSTDMLGIPVAVKDLYDTKDMQTTNGSLVFEGWKPERDATQVRMLREAGAVIIGKASLEEYAQSGQYSDSAYGQVWNGFSPSKSPIASSGGTGAAVATSLAPIGMGSQTGDSLYGPAVAASLFTLRGTDGMQSGAGVMPLTWWTDYGGGMARTPLDLAMLLNHTSGTDPEDEITVEADADGKRPADWKTVLDPDALKGKKIGWYASAWEPIWNETGYLAKMKEQWAYLEDAGAEIVEIDLAANPLPANPGGTSGDRSYEGWQRYIDRHPTIPYSTADQIIRSQKRLPYRRTANTPYTGTGRYTPEQVQALKDQRRIFKERYAAWFDAVGIDAVLYGGHFSDITLNDSSSAAFGRRDTPGAGPGIPTITFPAGVSPNGDPMGLQLMGRPWSDPELLGYSYAFDLKAKGAVNSTAAPALPFDPAFSPKPIEKPAPVLPEPEQPVAPVVAPAPAVAAATTATPRLTVMLPSSAKVAGGKVKLTVRSTSSTTIRGRVALRGTATVKGRKRTFTLGTSGRFTLAPNGSRTVTITLGPTATSILRGRTRWTVTASAELVGGGAGGTVSARVALRR
ncbi:MAG: amidase [Solirubrobacteraceae bacterium]